jgi:hypothetical protein
MTQSNPSNKFTRRQIITTCIIAGLLLQRSALASGRLSPNDAEAIKHGYVENFKQVDVKRFPAYKAGQTCENCKFIQARYGFYRPCELFPKKSVNEKGWCSAWVKKA